MVNEIYIYVEGGGPGIDAQAIIRGGFSKFLNDLKSTAGKNNIRFTITACGGRKNAKNDFFRGIKSHPDAFNVLLVDSESPVNSKPWEHLNNQDNWELHENLDDNCQLMVQQLKHG